MSTGTEMEVYEDDRGEIIQIPQAIEVTALEAMTRAEVDIAIATAKRYPRSLARCLKEAKTRAQASKEVAESCFYTLPAPKGRDKDGNPHKPIIGPNVRLAEILQWAWGNMRVVVRITQETEHFLVAQALAQDLENNNTSSAEVRRAIWSKRYGRYSDELIAKHAGGACSTAKRNAVFAVIPRALWNDIYMGCRRLAAGEGRSIEDGRKAVMDWAKGLGLKPNEVFAFLNIAGEIDMTLEHMEIMAGVRTSLKDGEATIESLFRPTADDSNGASRTSQITSEIERRTSKGKDKEPAPVAAPPEGGEKWEVGRE